MTTQQLNSESSEVLYTPVNIVPKLVSESSEVLYTPVTSKVRLYGLTIEVLHLNSNAVSKSRRSLNIIT